MAKFGPFFNGYVAVNGVDLSDHVQSFTINATATQLDNHAMGDDTATQEPGLLSWTIDVTFFADFAAGSVAHTLWPLYSGREQFAVVCKPADAAVASGNPQWSGQAFISSTTPLAGTHGDELMDSCTFSCAGTLVRTTS